MSTAVALIARQRLTGEAPPRAAEAGLKLVAPWIEEKAAAELEPEGGWEESDPAGPGEGDEGDSGPKRKRKRRE